MTLDEAIAELRRLNEPVPKPPRLPTPAEVEALERLLGRDVHPDLRRYLLEASDVTLGTLEPVTATPESGRTYLPRVIERARVYGVPEDLLPICEDNADFYTMTEDGEIVYWSHNGSPSERWPSLAAWIEEVWIGET
ncbi:MAG: SMI1/KNR4 family protein [Bacteroidota bacterium]